MSNHDLIFLNYLANVFDNLDDSIMLLSITDDAMTPLLVNEGFYRNSGRQKGSMQDLIDDISKSDTIPEYVRLCYDAMDQKQMVEEDLLAHMPIGERHMRTRAIPVLNSLAQVTHMVVIARDITESVLKDARIAELEDELKKHQKTKAKKSS
ncbi:hypothetical protein KC957_03855 [Candidatus Saccharibacteria bacterium]|nr:hypothetical protein [Candidatus Saccharibacteria bacterium]